MNKVDRIEIINLLERKYTFYTDMINLVTVTDQIIIFLSLHEDSTIDDIFLTCHNDEYMTWDYNEKFDT